MSEKAINYTSDCAKYDLWHIKLPGIIIIGVFVYALLK